MEYFLTERFADHCEVRDYLSANSRRDFKPRLLQIHRKIALQATIYFVLNESRLPNVLQLEPTVLGSR